MFKLNPKKVLIKTPTIYDYQANLPVETRKAIVLHVMNKNPKLKIKGGNSMTNPYKIPYELAIADQIDQMEKYKNSILWSPRMTPKKFTFAFIYPMGFALVLLWYIHNVAIPRRMVEMKRKYGYVYPELESKGWLDGWWDYEQEETEQIFDIINMEFKKTENKVKNKQYTDFTISDLQNFGNKPTYENSEQTSNINKSGKQIMQVKEKQKIQSQLEKILELQSKATQ
ncbi:unnamed protein product [Paramecium primaurelia]|uniref:Transmembrane protein n=1 Tax=Paramecium primaurelia TaxID=5886 RepID=A0A8S1P1F0_PARPR|nr:unnamed protein product [Paramecium primaurelia]